MLAQLHKLAAKCVCVSVVQLVWLAVLCDTAIVNASTARAATELSSFTCTYHCVAIVTVLLAPLLLLLLKRSVCMHEDTLCDMFVLSLALSICCIMQQSIALLCALALCNCVSSFQLVSKTAGLLQSHSFAASSRCACCCLLASCSCSTCSTNVSLQSSLLCNCNSNAARKQVHNSNAPH
jgi:hypothetical protein